MKTVKDISGPKGHWLFGSAKDFIKDPLTFVEHVGKNYKDIAFFHFGPRQIVFLTDPELVKHVLLTNNKNYKKGIQYEPLKLVLGNGLLTSDGDYWLRQRRIAQPVFHKQSISSFAEKMVDSSIQKLKDWEYKTGKTIDVFPEMMQLTLDIVGRTLLSTDVKKDAEKVGSALNVLIDFAFDRIKSIIKLPVWFPTQKNIEFNRKRKDLNNVVLKIIDERRKNPGSYNDLLTMLMEAKDEETGEQMTNEQLREEIMTIFIAGHETTANVLTFAWYLLSQNPEKEAAFHHELDNLNGKTPDITDLARLEYTRQVIYETMRLYPPAWAIGRRSLGPDQLGEYHIEKDTNVLFCPYVIHRDPKRWENVDAFIPERFSPEKMKEYHKFLYFPFGGGPRLCIGNNFALMEMQLAMATIGQQYQFEHDSNHRVILDPLVTLRPKNGMKMKITKRQ